MQAQELQHWGVMGMKWGQRKPEGGGIRGFVKEHKTGLKIAGGVAAGVAISGLAAYAVAKNPRLRNEIARVKFNTFSKGKAAYATTFKDRVAQLNDIKTWGTRPYDGNVNSALYRDMTKNSVGMRFAAQDKVLADMVDAAKKNPNLVKINRGW
jgi:hypothetical protein